MTATRQLVAVVTGAGRGIGKSIATGLAASGTEVILVSRNSQELESVAEEITGHRGRAQVMATDISTVSGVGALVDALTDSPPPSVLVNAAGTFGPIHLVVDTDPEEWLRTINTNLFGAYLTSRAFAPGMVRQGWGRILNVSSAALLHSPTVLNSAYATSKVALNQFTRNLAAELDGTGVTANVFHPGEVKTEMFESIRNQIAALEQSIARDYVAWVEWVERTGGDSPQKAVDLVLRVIADGDYLPDGQFLWIDDPLQEPIPSWPQFSSDEER